MKERIMDVDADAENMNRSIGRITLTLRHVLKIMAYNHRVF